MATTNLMTFLDGMNDMRTLHREGKALSDQIDNLIGRKKLLKQSIKASIDTADGVYTADQMADLKTLMGLLNTRLKAASAIVDTEIA